MSLSQYDDPEPGPGESLTQWALRTTRLMPGHMPAWNAALLQDRAGTEAKIRALPRLDRSEAFLRAHALQHQGPILVRNGPEHESRADVRTMTEGALR